MYVFVQGFTCLLTLILAGFGKWRASKEKSVSWSSVYNALYKFVQVPVVLLLLICSLRDLFRMIVRMRLLCAFLLLFFQMGERGYRVLILMRRKWAKTGVMIKRYKDFNPTVK